MKIAVVHDSFTQLGGAEKVALHLKDVAASLARASSMAAVQYEYEGFRGTLSDLPVALVKAVRALGYIHHSHK